MNPKLLAIVALRSVATLFTLQGQPKTAQALSLLAAGIESGADVDEHMQAVADKLKETEGAISDEMWDDVTSRILADSDRLQAR